MNNIRIVCLSDTHDKQRPPDGAKRVGATFTGIEVPDGDLVVHAGDFTGTGTPWQIMQAGLWFSSLPHKSKIFIAGNHDFGFEKRKKESIENFPNCTYLEDSGIEIEGLKIYGSPHQPWFFDWAFNLQRGPEIRKKWDLIPDDTDILITHGPPMGILDKNREGDSVGCEELYDTIFTRLKKLKLHIFGHIHEGYGQVEINGIQFINASICTRNYHATNKPIVIDL